MKSDLLWHVQKHRGLPVGTSLPNAQTSPLVHPIGRRGARFADDGILANAAGPGAGAPPAVHGWLRVRSG